MYKFLLASLLCFSMASAAYGQLRIGQTAGFTGVTGPTVKEATEGAKLYFDAVNIKGGIHGQRIELISLDDKFDPKLTVENSQKLIDQGVLCLFLNRGTPHTQAIMGLLTQAKIPLVGPSTGAKILHDPVHPWIFNVRTPYQREAERVIEQLHSQQIDKFAIVQVSDSFGDDVAAGVIKSLNTLNLTPVAHEHYNREKPEYELIMKKIIQGNPQTIIFIGSGSAVADGMKVLRTLGSKAQMLTLSNNASAGFVKLLGPLAHGVMISQAFPSERALNFAMVNQAHELAKVRSMTLTPASLEGFAAAKVVVEGLRKAGPKPTAIKLQKALESIVKFNLGGLEISYSPTDHTGLDYTDLSIVDTDGTFRR
jgi:branched-chain amino acid transport system substrate-binding protein